MKDSFIIVPFGNYYVQVDGKYKPFLGAVWENEANSNLKQAALE